MPAALSALGPGLLQLSHLLASCVSPYLEVFLSSYLSRAGAHTLEACAGASYTGSPASPTPMPTRRLNIPRSSALSQSPTGFAHTGSHCLPHPTGHSSKCPFFFFFQFALSFPSLASVSPPVLFRFLVPCVPGPVTERYKSPVQPTLL